MITSKVKNYFVNLLNDFNLYNKKDLMLLLRCFGFVVLQFLSFVFKPLVFVALVYVIVWIILDKFENKLVYIVFLLPFYNVFRYGSEFVAYNGIFSSLASIYLTIFVLLALIIVVFVRYIKDLISKKISFNLKSFLIWLAFYLLLIFPIKSFASISVSSLFVLTALFVCLFLFVQYKDEINLKKLLNFWFFAILFSVLIFLFKDVLPNLYSYLTFFDERINFLARDPNYFSVELIVLLSCYTVLFLNGYCKKSFPFVFIASIVLGLFANSKSFIICLLVYLLILMIMLIIKIVKDIKAKSVSTITIIIASAIVLSAILGCIIFKDKIANIFSRFIDAFKSGESFYDTINELTTYRLEIWSYYINLIFSSPLIILFGAGALNGYPYSAIHNTPLQLVYFGGVIWTISLLILLIFVIIKSKFKKSFVNFIPVILLFIFSLSLDMLFSYRTFILILIVSLALKVKKNKEIIEKEVKEDSNEVKLDNSNI